MPTQSLFIVLAALLLLFGCSQGSPPSQAPVDLTYETPEECFAAMQRGTETKSIPVLLSCFATRERNQQVGMTAHMVEREAFFQTPKKEAALALLKKNNLENADIMGLLQAKSMSGPNGVAEAAEMVGARVTNQVEFMEAAAALLKPEEEQPATEPLPPGKLPVLANVQIEGDYATADITDPETNRSEPILFTKENGSWVVTSTRPPQKN